MNGCLMKQIDIYEFDVYKFFKVLFVIGCLVLYVLCNIGQFGVGVVFIQFNGINYVGIYKEYVIVDYC